MFVFLTQIMLGHKILWVSRNNKPLEEAAKCFNSWIDSCPNSTIKEIRFKRYLGSSQPVRFQSMDVSSRQRHEKKFDMNLVEVLLITKFSFALAANSPYSKVKAFLTSGIDYLMIDEAQ